MTHPWCDDTPNTPVCPGPSPTHLWQLPKAIAGVQVGRVEAVVPEKRAVVQLNLLHRLQGRLAQVAGGKEGTG